MPHVKCMYINNLFAGTVSYSSKEGVSFGTHEDAPLLEETLSEQNLSMGQNVLVSLMKW